MVCGKFNLRFGRTTKFGQITSLGIYKFGHTVMLIAVDLDVQKLASDLRKIEARVEQDKLHH